MYKPIARIKPASYYPRDIATIYALLASVLVFGGIVAFVFDSVTLPGRTGAVTFDGRADYGVGVFCFFLAAYWLAKSVRHYTASRLLERSRFWPANTSSDTAVVVATLVCAPR